MPMNVKEFDNFFQRSVGHFSSKFRSKLWISFFVQNAKFRDFVRFSSKTNFVSLSIVYTIHNKHFFCLC